MAAAGPQWNQPAPAAQGDGREGRVRPAHHHRLAAAAAHRRRAGAAASTRRSRRSRPSSSATRCSPTRRSSSFEEDNELDLSFGVKGLSRFRANIFMQRGAVAGRVPHHPLQDPDLRTSSACRRWSPSCASKPRGLVLVTGPDRLGQVDHAGVDDRQDQHRAARAHHDDRGSDRVPAPAQELPGQPARGRRATRSSFKKALKYILRQDPDVVLVGEMRDLETIEAALIIAETGHLVFATLHTNSAVQTINRIIDVFPPYQQSQIRAQLSFVLEGVITQTLIPKADGPGRVLAMEVMVPNAAIRNLIREDKIHQIYSQMQIGQAQVRHADHEPVPGAAVPAPADHAGRGAGSQQRAGRAAADHRQRRRSSRRPVAAAPAGAARWGGNSRWPAPHTSGRRAPSNGDVKKGVMEADSEEAVHNRLQAAAAVAHRGQEAAQAARPSASARA